MTTVVLNGTWVLKFCLLIVSALVLVLNLLIVSACLVHWYWISDLHLVFATEFWLEWYWISVPACLILPSFWLEFSAFSTGHFQCLALELNFSEQHSTNSATFLNHFFPWNDWNLIYRGTSAQDWCHFPTLSSFYKPEDVCCFNKFKYTSPLNYGLCFVPGNRWNHGGVGCILL